MTNEYLDGPIIIDPITRKNVAKNSFRIDDVKDALGQAFDFLQNIKIQFAQDALMVFLLKYQLLVLN